jgi:hypothetical protein
LISIFAGLVIEVRFIVVMNAVLREDARNNVKTRGLTAALPRGRKTTVKLKIVVGMVGVKKNKKTWMIKVEQSSLPGV